MPHREEKIYLNAINTAFRRDFLTWFKYAARTPSFRYYWEKLNAWQKQQIDPAGEWQILKKQNVSFPVLAEKSYPALLKEIPYPPLALYMRGAMPIIPGIAVVGTRRASAYGKSVAEKLVRELVKYHFAIVSGLASGIDTIAHQTALSHGGKTVAVLGSGWENVYPDENKKLAQAIMRHGAVITEYPRNSPPLRSYFPWRNRIISGLSLATIVIEAPEKSGALITARFALEQNREVLAVPGSIWSKNSAGTHRLIQQGAKLVTKIEDILEELNPSALLPQNRP